MRQKARAPYRIIVMYAIKEEFCRFAEAAVPISVTRYQFDEAECAEQ